MNSLEARMVYDNAVKAFGAAFPNLNGKSIAEYCKLTQSTYRFEQPLVAGQTLYQFPVLANQQVFSNTEQRLNQQDSAVIASVFIGVGLPASSTDTAWIPITYDDPANFGANAVPLRGFWNGSNLSIAVNNDILMPNWDVFKHYNAPETQQTAALGAGSPENQLRGSFDGWYPMQPSIVLLGSKNNVLQITLPVGLTSVSTYSRAVIMLRCITAQNSTVVS